MLQLINIEVCQQVVGYKTTLPSYTSRSRKPIHYRVDTSKLTCTCPSFRHQHGTNADGLCKHIRDALSHACDWTELSSYEQKVPLRCPICGSKTVGVAW